MNDQSIVINTEMTEVPETWKRFYNGPNAGMIDIETARREMPWLIGASASVTLTAENRVEELCSSKFSANR